MKDRRHVPIIDFVGQGLINDVRKLIADGCDVNENDYYGGTAVLMCVERNDDAILEILIRANANLNVTDQVGMPVLQLAEELEHHKIVQLIKDAVAKKNIEPSDPQAQSEVTKDSYERVRFYPKGKEQHQEYQEELKSANHQDDLKFPSEQSPTVSSPTIKPRKL
jgi:ankyrin repeat protein